MACFFGEVLHYGDILAPRRGISQIRKDLYRACNKISDCKLQSLILLSKPVSRVLSFKTVIYLRRTFLHGSSHLSDIGRTNPPCGILSMLHRVGFTEPQESPPERWSLTPPFHPYRITSAVYFCCTFLEVASTGSYPAPCPMELGLSSLTLACPRDRSACSKCIILYHIKNVKGFLFSLDLKTSISSNFSESLL